MLRGLACAVVAAVVFGGAPTAAAEPPAPPAPIVPAPVQPPNIGELKADAIRYYDSGAYLTDLQLATAPALDWIVEQAAHVTRPAVVLDIDETALSNWEAIKANDFGRVSDGPCDSLPEGPCGWRAWDLLGRSPAIPPTQRVFQAALDKGVAVFFITGRDESQREATERNLAAVGYRGYTRLLMEPVDAHFVSASDFKAPQRADIERQGFSIIANLGDQPADLEGGFAARTFLLPNPFYRIP